MGCAAANPRWRQLLPHPTPKLLQYQTPILPTPVPASRSLLVLEAISETWASLSFYPHSVDKTDCLHPPFRRQQCCRAEQGAGRGRPGRAWTPGNERRVELGIIMNEPRLQAPGTCAIVPWSFTYKIGVEGYIL